MGITLQTFSTTDTDYVAKLNGNASVIQSAINNLQAAAQSSTVSALNDSVLTGALFSGVTTLVGTSSYNVSMSGANATVAPGLAWYVGANNFLVINLANVPLTASGAAGTLYVVIDQTGTPSLSTTNTNALYSLAWDGTTLTDVMRVANLLYTAADDTATLFSTTNAHEYDSLEDRLEAIETAINGFTAASAPNGGANLVYATPQAAPGVAALRSLVLADLPTLPPPATATTAALGIVQPDGTTITINSSGVISAAGGGSGSLTAPVSIPTVTPSTVGLIVQGSQATTTPPSAPVIVQQASMLGSTTTQDLTLTLANPVTAGNTLIAIGTNYNKFGSNFASDAGGNTYSQPFLSGGGDGFFMVNVAQPATAGSYAVTIHSDSGGYVQDFILLEVSGLGAFVTGQSNSATEGAGVPMVIPNSTLTSGAWALTLGMAPTGSLANANTALTQYTASTITVISGYSIGLWSGMVAAGTVGDSLVSGPGGFEFAMQVFFVSTAGGGPVTTTQTAALQQWQDHAGAVLSSVNGQGQIVMALTTGAPTSTPAVGAMAFDPAAGKLYAYGNSGWVQI